jgi:hypothetical protein
MNELIEKAFKKLEENDIVQCISLCLRLARLNNDYLNTAMFLREVSTDRKAFQETLFNETKHLNKEAQKFIFEKTLDKWLAERQMSYKDIGPNEPKINVSSIGELLNDIRIAEESLKDFKTPTRMTPIDTASFEDENQKLRGKTRLYLGELNIVIERIRARCLNFLITLEKQNKEQEDAKKIQLNFFNEVNNFFKERDNSVYIKLLKSLELLNHNDEESHSLLLTEIRRCIKSVADYFYPAKNEKIKCFDGQERLLGDDQYLNRLSEFIYSTSKQKNSRELLIEELENLDRISRKLNDLSSKGVHSNVNFREAKHCLLSFYNFVSNLILLQQEKEN